MKKKINSMSTLLIMLLTLTVIPFIFPSILYAVPAYDGLFKLTQPSGISFEARQRGDEWYNWVETKDGYGIYKNTKTGNWEYYLPSTDAETKGLGTVPNDTHRTIVGEVDPASRGIQKGLRPPIDVDISHRESLQAKMEGELQTTAVSGTIPILVIGVDYATTTATYTPAEIQHRFFGSSNSVADYYNNVSYSTVTITPASESHGTANDGLIGWLRLSGSHPYPEQYTDTNTKSIARQQLAKDAIIAADPYISYASYDTDGNGTVTATELSICIMVAGYEDSYPSAPSPSVYGHRAGMSRVGYPSVDGVTIREYAQFGEIHNDHLATIGIMCHELGHLTFSLPDLYDTTPISNEDSYGVGDFDLMGSGEWGAETSDLSTGIYPGSSPTQLSAWSKERLSWGTVNTISTNQEISLPKSDGNPSSIFRINTSDSNQYFLLENRQFSGYDKGFIRNTGVNSHGGLAIYHIDKLKTDLWPGTNTVNADKNSKGVDVEEANEGSLGSMLDNTGTGTAAHTNMFFFSGNNSTFTDSTTPNSKLKNGDTTDISVKDISVYSGTMTATVTLYKIEAQRIGAGSNHSIAIKSDGTIWAWGDNTAGQLGDGTSGSQSDKNKPVQVGELSGIEAIDGGADDTLALRWDGTVWACGWNSTGQLGDGTTVDRTTPVQALISSIASISGGYGHTVAAKSNGAVWIWGSAYEIVPAPAEVCIERDEDNECKEYLIGVIEVSTYGNNIALRSDGTVWEWNTGDGRYIISDVTKISSGGDHDMVIKSDGTVWTWGDNTYGQLGDGTTIGKSTPVQVIGLTNVNAIAGGHYHSVALKSDGTVWTWGYNRYGRLGDGTAITRTTPVQVNGLTDIVAIAAGGQHTLALKSDNTVWAWGSNGEGQLGDATNITRYTPVQVVIDLDGTPTPTETPTPTPTVPTTPTVSPPPTTPPPSTARGSIVGQVTNEDDGSPIAGATVSANGFDAITNADGEYAIYDVTPGEYVLTATTTGFEAAFQAVTVKEGETSTANFALQPIKPDTGHITGRVTNAVDGTGINGTEISSGETVLTTTTTVNSVTGVYALPDLSVGDYTLTASATGFESLSQIVTVIENETTISNFRLQPETCEVATTIEVSPTELTLKKRLSNEVTVTVTGEDGCPVERDTVKARVDKNGKKLIKVSPKKQKTDANGQAVFTIKAKNKTGIATVTFKDAALSTTVTVSVVKQSTLSGNAR